MSQHHEHTCRVWWHRGFRAWVWRCWDCVPPGQTYNDRADTWSAALGDLEAHFRNGQGLTHNAIPAPQTTTNPATNPANGPATYGQRWAA